MAEKTVKIDADLLKRVESLITTSETNKFKYVNKKHFIDLAVYEKLKKEEENGKKRGRRAT